MNIKISLKKSLSFLQEENKSPIFFSPCDFHKKKKICLNLSNRRFYLAVKKSCTKKIEDILLFQKNLFSYYT